MSRENVEIVRGVFETFQAGIERGDPGAAFDTEALVADAEWMPLPGFAGPAVYMGREGFVEFMRTWTEDFEDWSIRLERLIDAGNDRVVALLHQSATGKGKRRAGRITFRLALRAGSWSRRSDAELRRSRTGPRSRRA